MVKACLPMQETKRCRFDPWVGKIPWRRVWQPTLVFLPGESHGQRSLLGIQFIGSHRVRYDSSHLAHLATVDAINKLSLFELFLHIRGLAKCFRCIIPVFTTTSAR